MSSRMYVVSRAGVSEAPKNDARDAGIGVLLRTGSFSSTRRYVPFRTPTLSVMMWQICVLSCSHKCMASLVKLLTLHQTWPVSGPLPSATMYGQFW
eukprot:3680163-Prymnesium_polylepis.1